MSRADRVLVAAGGGALVLVAAAAWMLFSPSIGGTTPAGVPDPFAVASGLAAPSSAPASAVPATVVVDVQGGVAHPGVRELPGGSRIADAIAAAGGYAADADLAAAATTINLAEPLVDGGQVRVPRIGETATAAGGEAPAGSPPGGSGTASGGGGLVNLNTASPEELEALPGIGQVTVQKIVAARQERPFTSLDDVVQRGVIHRGQLEDIQGLATAG
jgi:competence protein ComEA